MTETLPSIVPVEVTDVDLAFPANALDIMPKMGEIPERFRRGKTAWNELFNAWFYNGLAEPSFHMVDGIEGDLAYRHLRVILGSYAPKHEHKEAAFAYLASLWFTKVVNADRTYEDTNV